MKNTIKNDSDSPNGDYCFVWKASSWTISVQHGKVSWVKHAPNWHWQAGFIWIVNAGSLVVAAWNVLRRILKLNPGSAKKVCHHWLVTCARRIKERSVRYEVLWGQRSGNEHSLGSQEWLLRRDAVWDDTVRSRKRASKVGRGVSGGTDRVVLWPRNCRSKRCDKEKCAQKTPSSYRWLKDKAWEVKVNMRLTGRLETDMWNP